MPTEYAELHSVESVDGGVDDDEDLQESDSDCNVDTDDDSDYVVSDDALSDSDAD